MTDDVYWSYRNITGTSSRSNALAFNRKTYSTSIRIQPYILLLFQPHRVKRHTLSYYHMNPGKVVENYNAALSVVLNFKTKSITMSD